MIYMLTRYKKTRDPMTEGLLWSIVSLLPFVPLYQRYYNTISLLLLFYWAVKYWPRPLPKVITWCSLLFLVPVSKLPLIAGVLHGRSAGAAFLQTGNNGMHLHLDLPGKLALATPFLFVLFALVATLFLLWRNILTVRR